jgi:hypothetical protein
MAMSIQGEKGDQWTLYWTETTKLKNGLTFGELKAGQGPFRLHRKGRKDVDHRASPDGQSGIRTEPASPMERGA